MGNLTPLSLRTAFISLSHFFPFFESHENIIENILFSYLSKWECKKYILPFSALEVYPKIMTSAAEKPGSMNKN